MRTHEKVVRPQTKGRRQYAGERKRMSAVAAKPILLPLPKTAVRKGVFFCILGRLMRTHEKVVRQQTKGRRQYAGERKRMSAVTA